VREQLGLRVGDEIEFIRHGDAIEVRKRVPASLFAPYVGYLTHLAEQRVDDVVDDLRGAVDVEPPGRD
jgi:bifunctional DNA-binding transcriptional regulator/antitoxin component of YhaV-PrlF toxin-antitoxin module